MPPSWTSRLRDPIWWNDLVQLAKTAAAAVVAWVIAAHVLDLPQPFLAPWAALLVVHATVYRTFSRGLRQVAATVIAVVLSTSIGDLMGLSTASVALLLVVGLVVGTVPWFGAEATTIATTGLIVLTTGFTDEAMLISRLLDTGIGIVVGLLVNLVLWPPLRRRTAAVAMDRIDDGIGELLIDMADGLSEDCSTEDVTGWVDSSRDLDGDIDHAWALVRQAQESARWNPRRSAGPVRDPREWRGLLRRMEQSVAEIRSMSRTVGDEQSHRRAWGDGFAVPWLEMLGDTGRAARDADSAAMAAVRLRLEAFSDELRSTERSQQWPTYGALIINLRNIIDAMDEVAAANPLGQPALPLRLSGRSGTTRG
ncbi:FUSC family protein [Nocardioides mesophilus]|uniref:FUSC family protein n=1 Tax=Nocardioides mesophilus TaxID=433659 RepID=A0A7G9RAN8_9ACTN|nr:aromatic acid exporter family protein [Nocardioides mesophilus]QNN52663.1 FUSC family protein [Nocardioides mesophilus]